MPASNLADKIGRLFSQFENQSEGAEALLPMLRQMVNDFKATGESSPVVDKAEKFLISKAA